MSHKFIMFLAMILIVGNLMCLIIDGAWLGANDLTLMQYLTGMNALQTASWTAIFTVPVGFFTHGLPKMLFWDFSFFDGAAGQLIRWLMFVITIGAIWAVGQEFRSTITSIFGRR